MKYLYEFIGAFFLVFTVGMTVMNPTISSFAPIAIATILSIMVYAGGHISGGHYNPAVSLSVFMQKKITASDLGFYCIAQILGGIIAAFTVIYFKGGASTTAANLTTNAILAEFLFTFLLCFVVLNVAVAKKTAGNSYFGFAIGFVLLVGAYTVGSISTAAFNPAVVLGEALMNLISWKDTWMLLLGNIAGAVAAALLFNAAHPKN